MTIFSGQSVISRVYTSRFGNGTARWNLDRSGTKKYQVPGTVPSGKPPKSEPYRTVPCRTMQWKSATSAAIFIRQRQNQTGNGQWAITGISEAEQRRKQYQQGSRSQAQVQSSKVRQSGVKHRSSNQREW